MRLVFLHIPMTGGSRFRQSLDSWMKCIREFTGDESYVSLSGYSGCEDFDVSRVRRRQLQVVRKSIRERGNRVTTGCFPYLGQMDGVRFVSIIRDPQRHIPALSKKIVDMPDNPQTRQLLALHDWRKPITEAQIQELEDVIDSGEMLLAPNTNTADLRKAIGMPFYENFSERQTPCEGVDAEEIRLRHGFDATLWRRVIGGWGINADS